VVTRKFDTIDWCVNDQIGHLVLNQPPSNKMTVAFFSEMTDLKGEITGLTSLKALIISGKGRHFSSGADLDELLPEIDRNAGAESFLQSNYTALSYLETLPFPVISVIRGACLGSALELALFSHFRFCGEEAVFGLPETTFNLIPGIGGIQRFAALSRKARALDYILTGRMFDAQRALELGIVDAIWPKIKLVDEAIVFAKQFPGRYEKGMREVYVSRYVRRKR